MPVIDRSISLYLQASISGHHSEVHHTQRTDHSGARDAPAGPQDWAWRLPRWVAHRPISLPLERSGSCHVSGVTGGAIRVGDYKVRFLLKLMNFVLKLLRFCIKNDEFCIKIDGKLLVSHPTQCDFDRKILI